MVEEHDRELLIERRVNERLLQGWVEPIDGLSWAPRGGGRNKGDVRRPVEFGGAEAAVTRKDDSVRCGHGTMAPGGPIRKVLAPAGHGVIIDMPSMGICLFDVEEKFGWT
jgi:hypothetical protein